METFSKFSFYPLSFSALNFHLVPFYDFVLFDTLILFTHSCSCFIYIFVYGFGSFNVFKTVDSALSIKSNVSTFSGMLSINSFFPLKRGLTFLFHCILCRFWLKTGYSNIRMQLLWKSDSLPFLGSAIFDCWRL